MTIFVGSTNPVKLNAVIQAASETWPEVVVKGYEVASGIPEQPIGDDQTRQGAQARAHLALDHGLAAAPDPTQPSVSAPASQSNGQYLGVGLEGGVVDYSGELWSTVWVAVADRDHNVFTANGARFRVPDVVAQRIRRGEEMGPVIAAIVSEADVRRKQGMIGVITNGFVDRTEEYAGIAKMALGLWYGRNWLSQYQAPT